MNKNRYIRRKKIKKNFQIGSAFENIIKDNNLENLKLENEKKEIIKGLMNLPIKMLKKIKNKEAWKLLFIVKVYSFISLYK